MRAFFTLLTFFTPLILSTAVHAQHAYTHLLPTTEDSEAAAVSSSSPTSTTVNARTTTSTTVLPKSASSTPPASPHLSLNRNIAIVTTCTDVYNRTFNSDESGYSYCLKSQSHVPPTTARQVAQPKSTKPRASGEVLFKVGH